LQLKVDQLGLIELSKKLEKKFVDEMKMKIGVDELKKNNTSLYRKIDDIQNKISKTLVDTLIDLQTEETPLITKTNNRLNQKCGSCDQPIKPVHYDKSKAKFDKTSFVEYNIKDSTHKPLPDLISNQMKHSQAKSLISINKSLSNNDYERFLEQDRLKFNNILNEEMDKINFNTSRIITAANNIIKKREKQVLKEKAN